MILTNIRFTKHGSSGKIYTVIDPAISGFEFDEWTIHYTAEAREQIISPITFMILPFYQSNTSNLSSIMIRWILDRFQNENKYDVWCIYF